MLIAIMSALATMIIVMVIASATELGRKSPDSHAVISFWGSWVCYRLVLSVQRRQRQFPGRPTDKLKALPIFGIARLP